MELKTPKRWTFWLSVVLVLFGIAIYAFDLKILTLQPLGLIISGYGILLLGTLHPAM